MTDAPTPATPEFAPDLSAPDRWQPILVQIEDHKFGWLQPIQTIFGGGWYVTALLSPEWNQPALQMNLDEIRRWANQTVTGIPEFVRSWWSEAAGTAEDWESANPGMN